MLTFPYSSQDRRVRFHCVNKTKLPRFPTGTYVFFQISYAHNKMKWRYVLYFTVVLNN